MPERLLQELTTATCKGDARAVLKRYAQEIKALDEAVRERVLAQAQDIIQELPE